MAKLFNMARMTTATTGTGTITLGLAVVGYLTFAQAGVANGDQVTYVIVEGNNREIGRGIYSSTGPTLTRPGPLNSTNGGAVINLTGAAEVFIDASAEDIQQAGSTLQEGRLEIAEASEYSGATDTSRALGVKETWDAALNATLTDGANIAVDFAAGWNFGGSTTAALALGGNRTLSAPSNVRGGMAGILWFTATGATRTLTLDAAWFLADGVEVGPYSITITQILGLAYQTLGSTVWVTGVLRRG